LKEWRIIRRNPMVFAALGAQMFYLLPAVVSPIALAFRRGAADPQTIAVFLAAGCVLGSSTMAGRGLWIVAGGEHAPDLLRTAPAHPGVIRWGKIFSVAGISVMLCAIIIRRGAIVRRVLVRCGDSASLAQRSRRWRSGGCNGVI
jgi:hypothetical protein